MNRHEIIGNLVRDPETGTTQSGANYCRFTLAVKKRFHKEGQPDADFIRVTAWRGLGDTCAKYLSKGRKVYVSGTPSVSVWTGQDGVAKGQQELTADEVEFLSTAGTAKDTDAPPTDPESGMTVVDDQEAPW